MFERFTTDARAAVGRAQLEARELGHASIGTGHLLLALAWEPGLAGRILQDAGVEPAAIRADLVGSLGGSPQGIDADALATIGIDFEAVRASAEEAFGPGALDHLREARIPLDNDAKRALELSLREAVALRQGHIGSEHLLLGLAHAPGIGRELLERRGLVYEHLRRLVLDSQAA